MRLLSTSTALVLLAELPSSSRHAYLKSDTRLQPHHCKLVHGLAARPSLHLTCMQLWLGGGHLHPAGGGFCGCLITGCGLSPLIALCCLPREELALSDRRTEVCPAEAWRFCFLSCEESAFIQSLYRSFARPGQRGCSCFLPRKESAFVRSLDCRFTRPGPRGCGCFLPQKESAFVRSPHCLGRAPLLAPGGAVCVSPIAGLWLGLHRPR